MSKKNKQQREHEFPMFKKTFTFAGKGNDMLIIPELFEHFWVLYQHKVDKAQALLEWNMLCKGEAYFPTPTWQKVKKAIHQYHRSRNWLEGFRKNPATWLHKGGWYDEYVDEYYAVLLDALQEVENQFPNIEVNEHDWKEVVSDALLNELEKEKVRKWMKRHGYSEQETILKIKLEDYMIREVDFIFSFRKLFPKLTYFIEVSELRSIRKRQYQLRSVKLQQEGQLNEL